MGHRWAVLATTVALSVIAFVPAARAQPADKQPGDSPDIEMEPDPDPNAPAPDPNAPDPNAPTPPDTTGQTPDDQGTPPATTEPDPATKAAAKKLIAGGDTFFKKGEYLTRKKKPDQAKAEYERALAAYQKALEMVPNPRILYPVAVTEQKLEKWVDAANHYRDYLKGVTDGDPKQRADAEKQLEAVKMSIGVLTLTVDPDGAQVTLDGNPVGTSPIAEPLFLNPGEYTLSFTADGFQPLEQKVTIEAGSESERTFTLQAVSVIIEAPTPPPAPEPLKLPPPPSKLVLYVTGGGAIALVAGAAVTGTMAIGKHSTFTDTNKSPGTRESARVSGKNLALATDLMIVGTVITAGVATYYYMKIYKKKHTEWAHRIDEIKGGAKVVVTPWVQPDAGGLAVGGLLW